MKATHRVKDTDGSTSGFMVEGKFVAYNLAKNSISKIENLTLQKNGIIRAERALPEIDYHDTVVRTAYEKLLQENPFQRDIQRELEHWKNTRYGQVLQLGGPRQVGKTTELLKFAYGNYKYIIYVNLADDRFHFADITKSSNIWLSMQDYCDRAGLMPYQDSRDTILIIDEIQTDKKVYNSIRVLKSSLKCDIVITGSYLGIVFNREGFFLPAGTITYADMSAMNFKEFARVFQLDSRLMSIDLYGEDEKKYYDELEGLYKIYRQIGGYPEVVKRYVRTRSVQESHLVIGDLLRIFKEESRNYFSQARDVEVFETVYTAALEEMCREKRGTGKDHLENEIANTIVWLTYTGILAACDLAVDGDIRKISKNRRLYFSDCGVVSYLIKNTLIADSSLEGLLTETFVFNELRYLFKADGIHQRVTGSNVCFSVYQGNELDFMLADSDKIIYGIEVKTTRGNPLSLKVFIDKRLIGKGIVAKPTCGGRGDYFDTIPVYAVGCRFPYK